MFCPMKPSKIIGNIQDSALRVTYDDQFSSFTELLRIKDDSAIHKQIV